MAQHLWLQEPKSKENTDPLTVIHCNRAWCLLNKQISYNTIRYDTTRHNLTQYDTIQNKALFISFGVVGAFYKARVIKHNSAKLVPGNFSRWCVTNKFYGVDWCGSLKSFSSLPSVWSGQVASCIGFSTWDPALIWNTECHQNPVIVPFN